MLLAALFLSGELQPLAPKENSMTDTQPEQESPSDSRIAWAEAELARLLEWVRAAESRFALVLPLSTAMLGALAVLKGVRSTLGSFNEYH